MGVPVKCGSYKFSKRIFGPLHICHAVWWPKVKPELGYLYPKYYRQQPTPELDAVKLYLAIALDTVHSREISKKKRGMAGGVTCYHTAK